MTNNFSMLPHLKNSIPNDIRGYSTGFYSIALEAWRRGIRVKFINNNRSKPNIYYKLTFEDKEHLFISSRGDLTTSETLKICRDKHTAKKYLQDANVPTPTGKHFKSTTTNEDIINYAVKKGFPLVIKPIDGFGGKGVVAGIQNEKGFVESLYHVREQLGYKNVIVEKHFEGEDLRVYVVDEEVVAITKRIPANVKGDDVKTIRELIKRKNELRKISPILGSSLIKIDQELNDILERQGLNLDSIPQKDKIIYLKTTNNISTGGDPIDITDEVPDKIKQVAVDAVKAIPNLPNAGVDLMVNFERDEAVVIEINTQASIRSHLFPMQGEARDVPSKIIDQYFPETKDVERNDKIYFDFDSIWELFQTGKLQEYTLPPIPKNEVQLLKFIISGKVQNVNYGAGVRSQARELNLHGYVKHLNNNQTEVVALGEPKNINRLRELLNNHNSQNSFVATVEEKEMNKPVKAGFTVLNPELDRKIKDGYYPIRIEGISKLRRPIKRRKKQSEQSKVDYKHKKELENILQSKSWRVTKPLRKLRNIFKNK